MGNINEFYVNSQCFSSENEETYQTGKRTDLTASPFYIRSKIQIGMTLNFTEKLRLMRELTRLDILQLGDDTLLRGLQEMDDVLDFSTIWHLILYLVDGIKE